MTASAFLGRYNQYNSPGLERRFWEKVDRRGPDECWPWLAGRVSGYGTLRADGSVKKAHRISWELANGPIPDGLLVCHRCDNPPCVNPAHLFLGTNQDNIKDAFAKGRIDRSGERNGRARLCAATVATIRRRASQGADHGELADEFGVVRSTVNRALRRETWTRLDRIGRAEFDAEMELGLV